MRAKKPIPKGIRRRRKQKRVRARRRQQQAFKILRKRLESKLSTMGGELPREAKIQALEELLLKAKVATRGKTLTPKFARTISFSINPRPIIYSLLFAGASGYSTRVKISVANATGPVCDDFMCRYVAKVDSYFKDVIDYINSVTEIGNGELEMTPDAYAGIPGRHYDYKAKRSDPIRNVRGDITGYGDTVTRMWYEGPGVCPPREDFDGIYGFIQRGFLDSGIAFKENNDQDKIGTFRYTILGVVITVAILGLVGGWIMHKKCESDEVTDEDSERASLTSPP